MKNLITNLVTVSAVLVIGLVISSCSSLQLQFYDKTQPIEEFTRVNFHKNLSVATFNDKFLKGGFFKTVVIPAGTQKFEVRYIYIVGNVSYTSDFINIIHEFEPNRFYYVYPTTANDKVSVHVIDATDITREELSKMGFYSDRIEIILNERADSEEKFRKIGKQN